MNFTKIINFYHEFFYEKADPRIRDFPLMGNPAPIFIIYSSYALFFKVFMPRIMKKRTAVDVQKYALLLNILIFCNCVFFTVWGFIRYPFSKFRCFELGHNNFGFDLEVVYSNYMYMISKFIYTFESLLVGLKKSLKTTETYLVIHHTSLPLYIWCIINYYPGGHATFTGFINCFFHTLLFGHRIIFCHIFTDSYMYKKRKSFTFWIFVFQFAAVFLHTFQLFIWNDCNFPIEYAYSMVFYVTLITILAFAFIIPQI